MENSFQTSFIPKKPIIDNGSYSTGSKNKSISIVISVSLLIIMAGSWTGLYFYRDYLNKNKESLSSSLEKIKGSFDENTISELEMYDKKTSIAKTILSNHVVATPIFEVLNDLTLPSIQYTKFSQKREGSVYNVSMSGISRDYKSIALQANAFNTERGQYFKDLIFSNLTKNKNNYVTFDLEFKVDPKLLSYQNSINNTLNSGAEQVTESEQTVVPTQEQEVTPTPVDSVNGQSLPVNNGFNQ